MKKHLSIQVFGLVQGVFFRDATKKEALALHLTGWVRNEPEGFVQIEAEGPNEAMKKLVDWCHQGSPLSRVEKVLVSEGNIENLECFEVRY